MSRRGDDLPDVLAQWAQALWDASEVVPPHRRVELLRRAVDRAESSVRLQSVPVPEATCLLGDILVALGELVWKEARSAPAAEACSPGEGGDDEAAAARWALWHCRRALHEGYGEARRVRARDLSILCGTADALLDCGRLQRDMLACGVDLALAQPAGISDALDAAAAPQPPLPAPPAHSPFAPLPPTPPPLPAALPPTAGADVLVPGGAQGRGVAEVAEAEVTVVHLAQAVDEMQVDAPVQPRMEPPAAPASLPPLPSAADCLAHAASLYADVLKASAAEWAAASRVSRLDTMYNAACACALRGGREEECAQLLGALAAEGALRRAELEGDVDLAPLVPTAWMQRVLRGLES